MKYRIVKKTRQNIYTGSPVHEFVVQFRILGFLWLTANRQVGDFWINAEFFRMDHATQYIREQLAPNKPKPSPTKTSEVVWSGDDIDQLP